MLQRLQTLFLIIALLCVVLIFVFPLITFSSNSGAISVSMVGLIDNDAPVSVPFIIPVVMNILAGILILVSILMYKKRSLQMRIVAITVFLVSLAEGLVILDLTKLEETLKTVATTNMSYGVAYWLPLGAVLLLVLAYRSIKKDEDLVRSVDRIR